MSKSSFEQYARSRDNSYMVTNFDVSGSYSSKYMSADQNTVGRMCTVMLKAMEDQVMLPKFIFIIPDDDIINYCEFGIEQFEKQMDRILNSIMSDHDKLLRAHKEYLPIKSRRSTHPQIIWIEPPQNCQFSNNEERSLFTKCLGNIAKLHSNTTSLALKKIWDMENRNLFVQDYNRYTAEGYATYWSAVDCTVKFADTILWQKIVNLKKQKAKVPFHQRNQQKAESVGRQISDRFHWNANTGMQRNSSPPQKSLGYPFKHRLPTPPGYLN